jgi:hypothetical protein
VYIKAWKQSTTNAGGRVLCSHCYATTFIMQLQETAKKAAKEAALLKDLQEGQEDDVMTYNGFY